MKIGFIGIGIMGAPMAGHLLDGGHAVFVYARKAIPQALLEKGAQSVATAKEAAQMLEISTSKAYTDIEYACAWLRIEMGKSDTASQ